VPIENLEAFLKEFKIIEENVKLNEIAESSLYNFLLEKSKTAFERIKAEIGIELLENISKSMMLNVLDNLWTAHLENLEYLREAVRLRAYGQHDPLVEYKTNAFRLFKDFFDRFEEMFFEIIFQIKNSKFRL